MQPTTLDQALQTFTAGQNGLRAAAAATLRSLSAAAIRVRKRIGSEGDDPQHAAADDMFLIAARYSPIGFYASCERNIPLALNPSAGLALAICPLDWPTPNGTGATAGSIFALLPARGATAQFPQGCFLQPGTRQLAAGIFLYGRQLRLTLTLGDGVQSYVYCPRGGVFVHRNRRAVYRRAEGAECPAVSHFSGAGLAEVAERVLSRGGVFRRGRIQCCADTETSVENVRLLYEAHPIAFLIEQSGGAATDGARRILNIAPATLVDRTPLALSAPSDASKALRTVRCLANTALERTRASH